MRTPLYEFSLPYNVFGMGYIFFFSSLFFYTPCGCVAHLLWVCIFYFFFFYMPCGHVAYLLWVCIFYFFLYSSYFFDDNFSREIVMVCHGVLVVDGWMDVLAIFQCRSIACEWMCT